MIDLDFLDELNRFNILIKKKVSSAYAGSHRSMAYGTGTELMDMRKYALGDDIRLIDWNIYARTEKLHVKRFREEKNLTVHIIVDYSKSMGFGKRRSKFDYASMIGLGFAFMSMKNNEKFEFSAFSDELFSLKPRKGSINFLQMIDFLEKVKVKGQSNFSDSMRKYKKLIKSRSLIIIVSDFLFDIDELKTALLRFGNQHQIMLVQVLDPEEINMKLEGDVNLEDSETGEQLKTYMSNRTLSHYRDELKEHIDDIASLSNSINANFISVTTKDNIFDVFSTMLNN